MHENVKAVAVGQRSLIYGGCVTKKERNRGNKRKKMSKQREKEKKMEGRKE